MITVCNHDQRPPPPTTIQTAWLLQRCSLSLRENLREKHLTFSKLSNSLNSRLHFKFTRKQNLALRILSTHVFCTWLAQEHQQYAWRLLFFYSQRLPNIIIALTCGGSVAQVFKDVWSRFGASLINNFNLYLSVYSFKPFHCLEPFRPQRG